MAIIFEPDNLSNLFIRPKAEADMKKVLAVMAPVFEKYNPSLPFEYRFVDEDFGNKFTNENRVGRLSGIFAVLAIFISCLGLFGLAAFMAERRVKEIGIRKVHP
jgi:putative ABC transport system permease protein